MKVILKCTNPNMDRQKCENLRDMVADDLKNKGVAIVPFYVNVYLVDDEEADHDNKTN